VPVRAVPWYPLYMSTRPKRPRDPAQLAYSVYLEAIGEAEPQRLPENTPAAVAIRRGAAKGGEQRASKLTPEQRRKIAQDAAKKRWQKPTA
jgi:hypothetical protein